MGLENTMNFSVNYHASEHDIVAAAAAIICSNPTTDNADCCGSWLRSRYLSKLNRFSTSANEMPPMWCNERTQMRPAVLFIGSTWFINCVSINWSNDWVANRWQWIDDTLHMYRSKMFEKKMQSSSSVYCENKNYPHCHRHHLICSNKYPVSKEKQDTLFLSITLPNVDWFSEFYHLSDSAVNA